VQQNKYPTEIFERTLDHLHHWGWCSARTGKALLDRCLCFGRCLDLGIFAGLFATGAVALERARLHDLPQ